MGYLGLAAGGDGDPSLGRALLDATTGIQGTESRRLAVPLTVFARGFAWSPGGEEERRRRETAWETRGKQDSGAGEGVSLVFWALRRPNGWAVLETHPLAPGCTFIFHSPGQGALWAPSNVCVCTLVCMSSTVHSQCHSSPDHVCRAPDLLCLTPESAV